MREAMHDADMREFIRFLLDRLEADPDEILEWFFMENRYGVERRRALEGLVADLKEKY